MLERYGRAGLAEGRRQTRTVPRPWAPKAKAVAETKTVGLSEEALRVLAAMGHASHTALDKMRAITRFVECVASSLPEPASADDLMPSLCLHVSAAAAAKVGPVSMHAEIEFVELFCRDDLLLLGREGYALASVKGAVSALGAMGTAAAAGGGGGE